MNTLQKQLLDGIITASKKINSKELIFSTSIPFLYPVSSLKIKDTELSDNYNIPVGLKGYGEKDLTVLVNELKLKIIEETEEDPITFEKIIKYEIL